MVEEIETLGYKQYKDTRYYIDRLVDVYRDTGKVYIQVFGVWYQNLSNKYPYK